MKKNILIPSLVVSLLINPFVSMAGTTTDALPPGTNAIYQERGNPKDLDLFWGSASFETRPIGPFKVIAENLNDTNPKIDVEDVTGQKWGVKFDEEVHSEVAASRLVWAAGYNVEENYFVPQGVVTFNSNKPNAPKSVNDLTRAKKFIDKNSGAFTNARFKRKHGQHGGKSLTYPWAFNSNPFDGTQELSGLILISAMLSNSDDKNSNNGVESVTGADGKVTNWFMITDLGGAFGAGKCGFHCSKWNVDKFEANAPAFVKSVSGGKFTFDYRSGKQGITSVPVAHAKFFMEKIGKLSDEQLMDALSAGLTDDKNKISAADKALATRYVKALRVKIEALRKALE